MKVKLEDGTEIECTPAEFIELKKQGMIKNELQPVEVVKPVQKIVVIPQPIQQPVHKVVFAKRQHIEWPLAEDNIIREFYISRKRGLKLKGPEFKNLCSILSHRTKLQITKRATELGLTKIQGSIPKTKSVVVADLPGMGKIKSKRKPSEWNMSQSERFSFMGKRIKYYMDTYNWSREKAGQQASADWENHKGIGNSHPVTNKPKEVKIVEFPIFKMLTQEGNKMLEEITRNIIGIGGSITYKEIQYVPIGVNGGCWSIPIWKEFVNEFITKSEQIAESFFKPNRFKMFVGENNYITIRYLG